MKHVIDGGGETRGMPEVWVQESMTNNPEPFLVLCDDQQNRNVTTKDSRAYRRPSYHNK